MIHHRSKIVKGRPSPPYSSPKKYELFLNRVKHVCRTSILLTRNCNCFICHNQDREFFLWATLLEAKEVKETYLKRACEFLKFLPNKTTGDVVFYQRKYMQSLKLKVLLTYIVEKLGSELKKHTERRDRESRRYICRACNERH